MAYIGVCIIIYLLICVWQVQLYVPCVCGPFNVFYKNPLIDIETSDFIKSFMTNDETKVRKSNVYCVMFGEDGSVENLAWSLDCILSTCEEPLRDKI